MRVDNNAIRKAFENNEELKKCSKILHLAAKNTTEKGFLKILEVAYSVIEDIIYNSGGDTNE